MDQLPSQYDNRTFDEQLKAFMQCKSAITKKPDTFMVGDVNVSLYLVLSISWLDEKST